MNNAVIGVGSNISPEENTLRAELEVALLGRLIGKSSFLYTKPLLYENQNDFLNGVFHIETPYEYLELTGRLKKIENKLGRVRTENKAGPRTIDLDTVIYNNQVKDIDAFDRDFIKNPVIELLPELSGTLNCSNYKNHFYTVHAIIEKILSLLPAPPVSVFGSGQWFCDEESAEGGIDIFIIVENTGNEYEEIISRELKRSGLGEIGSCPVRAKLFRLEELQGRSAAISSVAQSPDFSGSFASRLRSYKLLYGKPWPVSDSLLQG